MSYIKIYRKVLNSPIWQNHNDWRVAETLLLLANWKAGEMQARNGDIVKIQRGELVTSLKTLRRVSGLSEREIRTSLLHLRKADFLTSTSTSHFRKIKIKKYSDYQGDDFKSDKHFDKDSTKTRQGPDNDIRRSLKKGEEGEKGARRAPAPGRGLLPGGIPDTIENRIKLGDPRNFPIEGHPSWKGLRYDVQQQYEREEHTALEDAAVRRRYAAPEAP